VACGSAPLTGRLLAVNPELAKGGSAGISVEIPGGRREIVAWIRDYDPAFATTYWLRTPITLPGGSHIAVEAQGACSLTVSMGR